MNEKIIIDKRFCGPETSGNGGYACGLMAQYIKGTVEVTLRKPPPLNKPLNVTRQKNQVLLNDGEALIAEACPGKLDIAIPKPPSFKEATEALEQYRGFNYHPWPHCYVCGPLHPGGMGIHPGPVKERNIVASPWIPEDYQAGKDKIVHPKFQWAALDCPGFFSFRNDISMLLGRLTARIENSVRVGEKYITIAWPIFTEGRKHTTGSALFSENGNLCSAARGTWIEAQLEK